MFERFTDLARRVLVYAQDPEDELPLEGVHAVRVISTDTTLFTYRLALIGPPAELEAEIEGLAEWTADRATGRSHNTAVA